MRARLPTPTARTGRVLRVLTLLALLAAAVLAVALLVPDGERGRETPRIPPGELGVAEAIGRAPEGPVVIRGYTFSGPGGRELRLCDSREGGDPPRCIGPFVSLYGIDEGSFDLRSAGTPDGPVLSSPEPVSVTGTLSGTAFEAQFVLGSDGGEG